MATLGERLASTEARLNGLDSKVDLIKERVYLMDEKLSEVHTNIVKTSTNAAWLKKITFIVLAALIGGTITLGFSSINKTEGVAKANVEQHRTK